MKKADWLFLILQNMRGKFQAASAASYYPEFLSTTLHRACAKQWRKGKVLELRVILTEFSPCDVCFSTNCDGYKVKLILEYTIMLMSPSH